MDKIINKLNYIPSALSSLSLLLSCIYACSRLFLANWTNFNKLFLYGYIWYGLCGATAALSAIRKTSGQVNVHFHLAAWITSTIGLAKLAAQFYVYKFEIIPVGNLHLMSTAAVILAYFTRRPIIVTIVSHMVTIFSLISIIIGGLISGNRGNIWAASGAGLLSVVAYCHRSGKADNKEDVLECLVMIANILLMKGMVTDDWELPNVKFFVDLA